MIEFNIAAKAEHPVVQILSTEVYMLFKEAHLSGSDVLLPEGGNGAYKEYIAYAPGTSFPTLYEKMLDAGWHESYDPNWPEGVHAFRKDHNFIYIARHHHEWTKLLAWHTLLQMNAAPVSKLQSKEISNNLFKVIVMGYVAVKSGATVVLKHKKHHHEEEAMEEELFAGEPQPAAGQNMSPEQLLNSVIGDSTTW